ncbi:MAG: ferrous iron transport protein B [Clostridia bacterium]|nr:ferrous iron transport protein B [Clostridia bacterium]MBQ4157671.1 ferrous iron transport protein B [Clostridia bacterium]
MKKNSEKAQPVITVALTGNPNVGKSTLFSRLTGIKQHTGNWAGKTVDIMSGKRLHNGNHFLFVDLPGTYSLYPNSPEEEIARDFLLSREAERVCVILDATNIRRSLAFALSVLEIRPDAFLIINLADEAAKKGVNIDTKRMSESLNCPVLPVSARTGQGVNEMLNRLSESKPAKEQSFHAPYKPWLRKILQAVSEIKQIDYKSAFLYALAGDPDALNVSRAFGRSLDAVQSEIIQTFSECAGEIYGSCVTKKKMEPQAARADKILTGKYTAFPIMLLFLFAILYFTISFANLPSKALSALFSSAEAPLRRFFDSVFFLKPLAPVMIDGVYGVLTWVISVMLPPMAIFFPMFSLLEECGFLPRIAFNLDGAFSKCRACGKQGLTMCMGLGCNAVGITGCRIISSPRERMIALITNSLMPCNGRFPALIQISYAFLSVSTVITAFAVTGMIAVSILMTLLMSYLLSVTLLRGKSSFFAMEIPPLRKPAFFRVIAESLVNRAFKVLLRALAVAAPAGLIIWCLANISISGTPIIKHITDYLEPAGLFLGMDGAILTAFLLSLPANEIMLPLLIMIYLSNGSLTEIESVSSLKSILVQNGWTVRTALCSLAFTLMHFPCSTSLITSYKETKSLFWTFITFIVPLIPGVGLCLLIRLIV